MKEKDLTHTIFIKDASKERVFYVLTDLGQPLVGAHAVCEVVGDVHGGATHLWLCM